MADLALSCVCPHNDDEKENDLGLPISPEKPVADLSESAKNNVEESKKKDHSHGEGTKWSSDAMADLADSWERPYSVVENDVGLLISPEKPPDLYSISSSESAKNNVQEESKKEDHSHGEGTKSNSDAMADLADSWERPYNVVENDVGLLILPEKPPDLSSSSSSESAKNNVQEESKKEDHSHGEGTKSSSVCYMHEDVIYDIMLRLPVESLLRFRSVCGLWRSIIDSPTFINQHYKHNSNKSFILVHHMVSSCAEYDSKFCIISGNKYGNETKLCLINGNMHERSNLEYRQAWYSVNEITMLFSCDGIVCLLNEVSKDVAFWNPATKQMRSLPKSSVGDQCLSLYDEMSVEYGFGVDAEHTYKFVRILYSHGDKNKNLVELYNMSSDSWRTIHEDNILPFSYIDCYVAACGKERCFWIGYNHYDEISPILISLDLNNEIFEAIQLPGYDPNYCVYKDLDIFKDEMCYINTVYLCDCDISRLCFQYWMLDEDDGEVSWKKIGYFGPTCKMGPNLVLGISRNRDFILLGCWHENGEVYMREYDVGEVEEYVSSRYECCCCHKPQGLTLNVLESVHYQASLISV